MRGLCKANTHIFITVRMFYVVIYTQSVNRAKIIRCTPAFHDFWLIANFSTQNMRSPSNWTRFPGLWRRSNKFQLIVNFSKEFQLKVSDALVSCTLSRMHRKPLIWKVFSAFIRTPIKNSKKKIKHSEELNLVFNIYLFLSIKAFSSQLFYRWNSSKQIRDTSILILSNWYLFEIVYRKPRFVPNLDLTFTMLSYFHIAFCPKNWKEKRESELKRLDEIARSCPITIPERYKTCF